MLWNAFFEGAIILISWFIPAAYSWLIKDILIMKNNFALWGYELTEKGFFINSTN